MVVDVWPLPQEILYFGNMSSAKAITLESHSGLCINGNYKRNELKEKFLYKFIFSPHFTTSPDEFNINFQFQFLMYLLTKSLVKATKIVKLPLHNPFRALENTPFYGFTVQVQIIKTWLSLLGCFVSGTPWVKWVRVLT